MGHTAVVATGGSPMTRHVPWDPWPDVRWDALAIVDGLVFEVPEGWTARPVEPGIRLERDDHAVSIDVRSFSGDPTAEVVRRLRDRPDALVLESTDDRVLVALPEPDDVVIRDLRFLRELQVRIAVGCSARDWPGAGAVVDGLLDSRWRRPLDEPPAGNAALAAAAGPGPTLPWRTPDGVLDQLVRFRDRGLVPAAARRSGPGVVARELGFVGRFGGLTDKGDELVSPVVDHDALLVVESSDPASDAPPLSWACWMQGQKCVVRVGHEDGSESLGVVRPGSLVAHLLRWLDVDPVDSVGVGEPVTITTAQYEDRSGPCPSDVEWFQRAWAAPRWRSVNGWSHQAGKGVHGLLVPGVGALTREGGDGTITLRPERTAVVVRGAVEGVNAFVGLTDGARPQR
ncbi:hypothetical protein [Curtobacterium sp. MCBD17_026]|uniref:hypothetical protein n=1 Tax=Curtobacterium sp. MCBD17_026 TaxID=2175621 RepID=UPI000DAA49ED|nr:hypothetical protein [Curtobacterium sp. MCBD17_026]WIB69595.1 hypothetical protein DEI85_10480 [Curtobacterium sp. MCBD17_026]